jgi:hypothetical protein
VREILERCEADDGTVQYQVKHAGSTGYI